MSENHTLTCAIGKVVLNNHILVLTYQLMIEKDGRLVAAGYAASQEDGGWYAAEVGARRAPTGTHAPNLNDAASRFNQQHHLHLRVIMRSHGSSSLWSYNDAQICSDLQHDAPD